MGWSEKQARAFHREAVRAIGKSTWNSVFTPPEVKEALIAQKVLGVILIQDAKSVQVEDVRALYNDMLRIERTGR